MFWNICKKNVRKVFTIISIAKKICFIFYNCRKWQSVSETLTKSSPEPPGSELRIPTRATRSKKFKTTQLRLEELMIVKTCFWKANQLAHDDLELARHQSQPKTFVIKPRKKTEIFSMQISNNLCISNTIGIDKICSK